MMMSRRGLVSAGSGLLLAGCDSLAGADKLMAIVKSAETASMRFQRLVGRDALAREFGRAELSPVFKVNGTHEPVEAQYQTHKADNFARWRVTVGGLVSNPLKLSLVQLQAMPARTQITRHDCVEGWSAIGEWSGPQLKTLLQAAGMTARARYVVFRCADNYGGARFSSPYYESVDLIDAFHPQTILALRLNGAPLSVGHGAPVRLRVERQLGYKHAKYVMAIDVVDSLAGYGRGKGGYWEDRGYEWYAGI